MPSEDFLVQLRELLMDRRMWCAVGQVLAPNATDKHFAITGDDVYVDVQLSPNGEQVLCRLGTVGGGIGLGIWSIPPPGSQVAVLVPQGDVEADPVVVAVLSSGAPPDGLADGGTIVIAVKGGQQVLIHDGSASDAKPLCTKADFDNHQHLPGTLSAPSTGGQVTGSTGAPSSAAAGTQVLKAK